MHETQNPPAPPPPLWTDGQQRVLDQLCLASANQRLHHAYIVVDRSGTLVAEVVRRFVNARICPTSCGQCPQCRQLSAGSHNHVLQLGKDLEAGDSIKVGSIRDLRRVVTRTTTDGGRRYVVMLGADRMTIASQNALLKTLEEPPGATTFLLGVRQSATLLPTIRSRCQLIALANPPLDESRAILSRHGLPQPLLEPLAFMVGADTERAQALVDLGAEGLWQRLTLAASGQLENDQATLDLASDMGASAEKLELATGLLEVLQRRALADKFVNRDDPTAATPQPQSRLMDEISRYRRNRPFNPNRTMVAESLLLCLGVEQPR